MPIPIPFVGLVIGKGGEMIRSFQERAQCRMFMVQDGEHTSSSEKVLTFQGSKVRVEEGKRLVKEFLDEKEKVFLFAHVSTFFLYLQSNTIHHKCIKINKNQNQL